MLGHLAPGQERIVPEGTVTQYSCDHGYQLEGNERRACVAGEWQGGLPECVGTYIRMYAINSVTNTL